MKKPKPAGKILPPDVLKVLGRRASKMSERELMDAAKKYHEAGRHALLAEMGSARQSSEAMAFAKSLLGKSRLSLASKTFSGSTETHYQKDWKKVQGILDKNSGEILSCHGVLGYAVAYRRKDGIQLKDELCMSVFVKKKIPEADNPKKVKLLEPAYGGAKVGSAPVDVIEFGEMEWQLDAGSSLGPRLNRRFGTLGAFAKDIDTGNDVALTAMHVIGSDSAARAEIMSPFMGGPNPEHLGFFLRGTRSGVDAAAIEIGSNQSPSGFIEGIGEIRGWRPMDQPGDRGSAVWMHGAASKIQSGVVVEPVVHMPELNLDSVILVDIESQHGDSGAALMDNENLVLGLLIGRSTSLGWRVFTPIGLVLDALSCEIPFK